VGDTLNAGQKLGKGDSLTSSNGAYSLTLQDDGNLVLAARGEAVWSTETNGEGVDRAEAQSDGNFVLYAGDTPKWHTETKGKKGIRLVVQDDRNVVLYSGDGVAWSSRTETDAPPPPLVEEKVEIAPVAAEKRTHIVAAGDTLFNIAKQYLGDGNRYQELATFNNIANPDHIEVGQLINIP